MGPYAAGVLRWAVHMLYLSIQKKAAEQKTDGYLKIWKRAFKKHAGGWHFKWYWSEVWHMQDLGVYSG